MKKHLQRIKVVLEFDVCLENARPYNDQLSIPRDQMGAFLGEIEKDLTMDMGDFTLCKIVLDKEKLFYRMLNHKVNITTTRRKQLW